MRALFRNGHQGIQGRFHGQGRPADGPVRLRCRPYGRTAQAAARPARHIQTCGNPADLSQRHQFRRRARAGAGQMVARRGRSGYLRRDGALHPDDGRTDGLYTGRHAQCFESEFPAGEFRAYESGNPLPAAGRVCRVRCSARDAVRLPVGLRTGTRMPALHFRRAYRLG